MSKAIVASIDPSTQAEWICHFNTIDTSGDGFLQRSEIIECLKACGQSPSAKDVEKLCESVGFVQEYDESGGETNGMDLDQFILMMALQDKAAKAGEDGASAVGLASAFSNTRMAELAKRNSFKHKPRDANFDSMDLVASKTRCKNCRGNYLESENNDEACVYHPGPMKSEGGRVANHLDKTLFKCCGTEQIGTSPVLFAPPGCVTSKHVPDTQGEAQ